VATEVPRLSPRSLIPAFGTIAWQSLRLGPGTLKRAGPSGAADRPKDCALREVCTRGTGGYRPYEASSAGSQRPPGRAPVAGNPGTGSRTLVTTVIADAVLVRRQRKTPMTKANRYATSAAPKPSSAKAID
jgi:hypothetical protein